MNTPFHRRLFWPTLAALAVLLPILCTITTGGSGEFSPQTLQYRFRREVWVGYGMFPIYISGPYYSDHSLLTHLRENGYGTSIETTSPRWEGLFRWNHAWRDGYNQNFSRYQSSVIAWGREDPELAQFFWSETFRLLRSDKEADRIAGEVLLSQRIDYQDRAEIQEMIDHSLEFAEAKIAGREFGPAAAR